MLSEVDAPAIVTRNAREHWWHNIENVGLPPYPASLLDCSGGLKLDLDSVASLAQTDPSWAPDAEAAAIFAQSANKQELAARATAATAKLKTEILGLKSNVVVVVTHFGVIDALCECGPVQNCSVAKVTLSGGRDWDVRACEVIPHPYY